MSTYSTYGRVEGTEASRIRQLRTWPYWPWLPVKRHNLTTSEVETGIIFADHIDLPDDDDANGPVIVWNAPLWPTMKAAVAILKGVTPTWPELGRYPTVEAMLNDGWVVD